MAVYVDALWECGPVPTFPYKYGCHLMADTRAELLAFAARLGLKLTWLHHTHFDITPPKRALAKRLGALDMPGSDNWREKAAFLRRVREQWSNALAAGLVCGTSKEDDNAASVGAAPGA